MAPVSDNVACFDSLPNDLVGVIMSKLDLPSTIRLTQACPTARRLVQGERAVPGVLGKVSVDLHDLADDVYEMDLRVQVTENGLKVCNVKRSTNVVLVWAEAAADEEDHAERQPSACIVHLLEWIRVRARAFTEIEIVVNIRNNGSALDHIASTFLPNVPSSFRGKISFDLYEYKYFRKDWERVATFLAAWRALAPAYECGLTAGNHEMSRVVHSLRAAPSLSSLFIQSGEGEPYEPVFRLLAGLDTSRLTKLDISSWMLESLPSKGVLPPTLRDLNLGLHPGCWSSLDAFLAPLHRLTALRLSVGIPDEHLDSPLITLAPFEVLPNLRLLVIDLRGPWPSNPEFPPVESAYWKEPIVLPALEDLMLLQGASDAEVPGVERGPAAGQSSRWPTLLSNLEAPKLERLVYEHEVIGNGHDRTLDLPLGRFPCLRAFEVSASTETLNLLALRAEMLGFRMEQCYRDAGEKHD